MALVAARNEQQRLPATLAALRRSLPGARVWLADDASTDDTAAIGERHGACVVSTRTHSGKGAAMTLAARRALESGAAEATVLLCDGDLGASALHLAELVAIVQRGEAEIAVGAFALRRGGGFGLTVGFARLALARAPGARARAPLSGQRALRAGALGSLLPFADGFGMELAMTLDAHRAGMRIVERELPLEHREHGRDVAGFVHRGRQLRDIARAYARRR
ncbi:MAG TPA: glycosyltransferase [Solirubrobacteraceae bacterium]|nr:glycosyltransferase [Solirubrobacteraceae bacterium]